MTKTIIEGLLHLILVSPLVWLGLKNKDAKALYVILVFSIYFILNRILLYLPLEFEYFKLINGNRNWTGKILAILGSILFLLLYRKFSLKDYFLTFKQKTNFRTKGILVVGTILIIQILSAYFFEPKMKWDLNFLSFQFLLPGIDEEIAFRGIMLGLLTKTLKIKNNFIHLPILITAILFGLAHGLFLTETFAISFKFAEFIWTFTFGIIWGWITIKSGSILLAIISHNFGNGFRSLIWMK